MDEKASFAITEHLHGFRIRRFISGKACVYKLAKCPLHDNVDFGIIKQGRLVKKVQCIPCGHELPLILIDNKD